VYAVVDETTGDSLALKRLSVTPGSAAIAEVMLAREYNALAHLSHPLVVSVYDYGRDSGVPYYTMELLSGENLRDLSPLGWRDACYVLRDVASALGIIHSRRLVHRDVTTRNVCRVEGGRAKLLDFGALTPMGPIRDLVGTPPFVPPEALEEQRLDGRADLFALGAVAYFVLTGQHAYGASTFRELGHAWRFPVNPPSAITPDIPAALDELVLSLLSLVRTARPQSAAEVFRRLSAIAALPPVDAPEVAQAYLATPSLVGRERAFGRVRKHLDRLKRGKGSALLVEGAPGVGRSRLLGAFLLEAKLLGKVTLRASGRDSSSEPFHVVRALAREYLSSGAALESRPEGADAGAPALFETTSDGEDWHAEAARLVAFFTQIAEGTPLVLAVDDVDAADDASLTSLALLSQSSRSLPLLLLFTSQLGARRSALVELRHSATSFVVDPLTAAETRTLVSSLFGDVPQVEALSEWVYRLAEGSPRASLELAQHLVDSKVAVYTGGAWALPVAMEALGLPQTIDQALEAKIAALGSLARELLQTLSLMTDHEPLPVTHYSALAPAEENLPALFEALNELIVASVVVSAGDAYVVAHQELVQIARRSIPDAELPGHHRRLAEAYASGPVKDAMVVVHHLYQCGDRAAAFRSAVQAIIERSDRPSTRAGIMRSREGTKLNEGLFLWGLENGAHRRDLVVVGRSLLQLASVVDAELIKHADRVLAPLREETGLVYWAELGDVRDPAERMQLCLGRAFAAYQAAGSDEALAPAQAIAELATSCGMLIGVYSREFDARGAAEVSALLEPLRSLSPAVDVVADLVQVAEKALRGHTVVEDRLRISTRVSTPIPGLDDLSRQGIRFVTLFYLALDEASHGREHAAERVELLEAYPHLAPLAWQVRMLLHLFLGRSEEAEAARRKRDAAAVGRGDIDRHLDLSLIYEASVSSMLGDLLALERTLGVIAERSVKSPGWEPYHQIVRGNYHSLRGDAARAVEHHLRAVELVPLPGVHAAWGLAVNSLASSLLELERAEEARALVGKALSDAEAIPILPSVRAQLEMNLAHAQASLGETAEATRLARHAVDVMLESDVSGAALVDLYVKQALVALKAKDTDTLQAVTSTIEVICRRTPGGPFIAKLEFLLRQARTTASFRPASVPQAEMVTRKESHTTVMLGLRTELRNCRNAEERAAHVLGVLLEWSGTDTGFLYLFGARHLSFTASTSGLPPPSSLEDRVNEWAHAFRAGDAGTRTSSPLDSESDAGDFEAVGLVAHLDQGTFLAGVVALSGARPRGPVPENILSVLGESLLSAGDAIGRPVAL
jgi:tetratricopeptide (TPR) repeat protein